MVVGTTKKHLTPTGLLMEATTGRKRYENIVVSLRWKSSPFVRRNTKPPRKAAAAQKGRPTLIFITFGLGP